MTDISNQSGPKVPSVGPSSVPDPSSSKVSSNHGLTSDQIRERLDKYSSENYKPFASNPRLEREFKRYLEGVLNALSDTNDRYRKVEPNLKPAGGSLRAEINKVHAQCQEVGKKFAALSGQARRFAEHDPQFGGLVESVHIDLIQAAEKFRDLIPKSMEMYKQKQLRDLKAAVLKEIDQYTAEDMQGIKVDPDFIGDIRTALKQCFPKKSEERGTQFSREPLATRTLDQMAEQLDNTRGGGNHQMHQRFLARCRAELAERSSELGNVSTIHAGAMNGFARLESTLKELQGAGQRQTPVINRSKVRESLALQEVQDGNWTKAVNSYLREQVPSSPDGTKGSLRDRSPESVVGYRENAAGTLDPIIKGQLESTVEELGKLIEGNQNQENQSQIEATVKELREIATELEETDPGLKGVLLAIVDQAEVNLNSGANSSATNPSSPEIARLEERLRKAEQARDEQAALNKELVAQIEALVEQVEQSTKLVQELQERLGGDKAKTTKRGIPGYDDPAAEETSDKEGNFYTEWDTSKVAGRKSNPGGATNNVAGAEFFSEVFDGQLEKPEIKELLEKTNQLAQLIADQEGANGDSSGIGQRLPGLVTQIRDASLKEFDNIDSLKDNQEKREALEKGFDDLKERAEKIASRSARNLGMEDLRALEERFAKAFEGVDEIDYKGFSTSAEYLEYLKQEILLPIEKLRSRFSADSAEKIEDVIDQELKGDQDRFPKEVDIDGLNSALEDSKRLLNSEHRRATERLEKELFDVKVDNLDNKFNKQYSPIAGTSVEKMYTRDRLGRYNLWLRDKVSGAEIGFVLSEKLEGQAALDQIKGKVQAVEALEPGQLKNLFKNHGALNSESEVFSHLLVISGREMAGAKKIQIENANLSGVRFKGATLKKVGFSESNLDGALIEQTVLDSVKMENNTGRGLVVRDCKFIGGSKIIKNKFIESEWSRVDLGSTKFKKNTVLDSKMDLQADSFEKAAGWHNATGPKKWLTTASFRGWMAKRALLGQFNKTAYSKGSFGDKEGLIQNAVKALSEQELQKLREKDRHDNNKALETLGLLGAAEHPDKKIGEKEFQLVVAMTRDGESGPERLLFGFKAEEPENISIFSQRKEGEEWVLNDRQSYPTLRTPDNKIANWKNGGSYHNRQVEWFAARWLKGQEESKLPRPPVAEKPDSDKKKDSEQKDQRAA